MGTAVIVTLFRKCAPIKKAAWLNRVLDELEGPTSSRKDGA